MRTDKDLLKEINRSGFPLQIAIERLVRDRTAAPRWNVRYVEHAWHNERTRTGGWVDLVLSNDGEVFNVVVECKRVQETSWMFLRDGGEQDSIRAKPFVVSRHPGGKAFVGWDDVEMQRGAPESSYAVIIGDAQAKGRSLLENLAGSVTQSVEAIAKEEYARGLGMATQNRLWFPIIVTTAVLKVCNYADSAIDLASGTFSDASFSDAEVVAFRKQVSAESSVPDLQFGPQSAEISIARESTVFVVDVRYLAKFLRHLNFLNPTQFGARMTGLALRQ